MHYVSMAYIPAYIRYKFQQEDWGQLTLAEHQSQNGRSEREVFSRILLSLCNPLLTQANTLQVKIEYLQITSQLPLYGAALFPMELQNNIIDLVRDQGYIGKPFGASSHRPSSF